MTCDRTYDSVIAATCYGATVYWREGIGWVDDRRNAHLFCERDRLPRLADGVTNIRFEKVTP